MNIRKKISLLFAFLFWSSTIIWAQIDFEAEGFDAMSGVQTQACEDVGGGLNVGYVDAGDWLSYAMNVPSAGDFELSLRYASASGGGSLTIEQNGVDVHTITIPSTGGWQTWETLTSEEALTLTAGEGTLKLKVVKGGFNLNYFSFRLVNPVDTDKPSTPVILSKSEGVHGGELVWTPSEDATSAIATYKIFNGEELWQTTADTMIVLDQLPPNSTLDIGIVAFDLAGNVSDTAKTTFNTTDFTWELQWSDEFDYSGTPDPEKWWFETGGHGWGNEEAQYYTDGENANVEDGMLVIETRKETYESNEFTSSRINSVPELDFLYGRIEVKAKLPQTKGSWPAIWTLPTDWVYGGWPACGEIDIMEHSILTGYGYVFGTVHTGTYNHEDGTQLSGGVTFEDVTDTWRTYAIEWYPDHIDWYIDDMHVFRFDNEYKTTDEWPYDIRHHLILNVAVGGGLGGDIDMDGVWPQRMLIDYVRVYDFKLGEGDSIAPEPVSELVADVRGTIVDLSWNSASDNYAVKEYQVLKDGQAFDTTRATNLLIQGLMPETAYVLSVLATDYSDNASTAVSTTVLTAIDEGIEVPGIVQAEDYFLMEGIQTQDTEDAGGGLNVGYVDGGDWLSYLIDVKETMEYQVGFRLAAESSVGDIVLSIDDDILTSIETPITGGWQAWGSVVSEPFTLEAGLQTIKLSTAQGRFNLNYMDFRAKDGFVGVEEGVASSLLIYPNPIHDGELTIVLPLNMEESKIQVMTIDGKLVHEQIVDGNTYIKLNSQSWQNGVYLISVTAANQVYTQKIYKF